MALAIILELGGRPGRGGEYVVRFYSVCIFFYQPLRHT